MFWICVSWKFISPQKLTSHSSFMKTPSSTSILYKKVTLPVNLYRQFAKVLIIWYLSPILPKFKYLSPILTKFKEPISKSKDQILMAHIYSRTWRKRSKIKKRGKPKRRKKPPKKPLLPRRPPPASRKARKRRRRRRKRRRRHNNTTFLDTSSEIGMIKHWLNKVWTVSSII